MNKNSIKKLVITIVFIVFLVMLFLFIKGINENKENKKIKIVKSIIKEKYDNIYYNKKSKYIYTEIKEDFYRYEVFDFHGNKLYSIQSENKLNIVMVMKKYYITYDDNYHLYNNLNEEIRNGKVIESLNEELIMVDDNIINNDNEILFKGIHKIKSYSNNNYFNINNYYLVDKKGNIILDNIIVNEEIKKSSITDYLIVKKGEKYYTFFTKLDQIIGDGFDSYSIGKNVLIKNDNEIFKIYKTGLRKKVITIPNKLENKYIFDNSFLMSNKSFVINKDNNYFGLLDITNNKFYKITKKDVENIIKIDHDNYVIETDKKNIVYNITNHKSLFESTTKIDNIVIFDNGYKTIKNNDTYSLYDKNNNIIIELDKQIIINSKIIVGKIDHSFYYYNLNEKKSNNMTKINIDNNTYYYDNKKIYNEKFKKLYKSNFISYNKNCIIYEKNNEIIFNNIKEKKLYKYELMENEYVVNNDVLNNIIIIEGNSYIKILDERGFIIKKIKNRKIINYYVTNKGRVIIITGLESENKIYQGSYLAE